DRAAVEIRIAVESIAHADRHLAPPDQLADPLARRGQYLQGYLTGPRAKPTHCGGETTIDYGSDHGERGTASSFPKLIADRLATVAHRGQHRLRVGQEGAPDIRQLDPATHPLE